MMRHAQWMMYVYIYINSAPDDVDYKYFEYFGSFDVNENREIEMKFVSKMNEYYNNYG